VLDDQRDDQETMPRDASTGGRDEPPPTEDSDGGESEPIIDRATELEGHLRRALADLDNIRKRFEREVARERSSERARAALLWLPVVDDLERALQHADDDPTAIVEGIQAVHEHALAVLSRLGFPRFDDIGQLFDPHRDEAITTVDTDAPPGTVVATVRPGYGTDEDILRPAGVIVSRTSD
jgi:molecular chaperone GrpE